MRSYVDEKGRVWTEFSIDFNAADGPDEHVRSFRIMAVSFEHARALVDDIRSTARLAGQFVEEYPA